MKKISKEPVGKTPEQWELESSMELGQTYMKMGLHKEAISFYDQCLNETPGFLPAIHGKARCFLNLKKYDSAIACLENCLPFVLASPASSGRDGFQEAVVDAPNHSDTHCLLGLCFLKSGKPEAALWHADKALHIDNLSTLALVLKAQCEMAIGNPRRISDALMKIAEKFETYPVYEYPHNELNFYSQALEYCPDDPELLRKLGYMLCCHPVYKTEEGLPLLRKAVELGPEDWEAHRDLGVGLLNSGQIEEAHEHLLKAFGMTGGGEDDLVIHVGLSKCYQFLGDRNKFMFHWGRAQQIVPIDAKSPKQVIIL